MLEIICDIKNNKRKPNEDSAHHTRIKKWLQKVPVSNLCFVASSIFEVSFSKYYLICSIVFQNKINPFNWIHKKIKRKLSYM